MKNSMFSGVLVTISLLAGALSSNHAEAGKYQKDRTIAASVTKRTGGESTVVGHSKNRKYAYVRSDSNIGGSGPTVKTRKVRRDTLKIVKTSGDHSQKASDVTALHAGKLEQYQGADMTNPPPYVEGMIPRSGNIGTMIISSFERFVVVLTKSGSMSADNVRRSPAQTVFKNR